jgi:hypothetical protein
VGAVAQAFQLALIEEGPEGFPALTDPACAMESLTLAGVSSRDKNTTDEKALTFQSVPSESSKV